MSAWGRKTAMASSTRPWSASSFASSLAKWGVASVGAGSQESDDVVYPSLAGQQLHRLGHSAPVASVGAGPHEGDGIVYPSLAGQQFR